MSTDQPSSSRAGLPASGPGSPASWARRFGALMIDWVLANVAALILVGGEAWEVGSSMTWVPLGCFFGMVWLSTAFTGASMGQWMLGVRIVRLGGGRVGVLNAALRTALVLLVIPPIVADQDRRGLHDHTTKTAAVNGPQRGSK